MDPMAYATTLATEASLRDYRAYEDDPQGVDGYLVAQADAHYLAKVLRSIALGQPVWQVA